MKTMFSLSNFVFLNLKNVRKIFLTLAMFWLLEVQVLIYFRCDTMQDTRPFFSSSKSVRKVPYIADVH